MDGSLGIIIGIVFVLIAFIVAVYFVKRSAWYTKVIKVKGDVYGAIDDALGWVASPWLWIGAIWVLYNPGDYSYFSFVTGYDFESGSDAMSFAIVFVGVILTIVSLYFLTKAWKKLAKFGHFVYIMLIGLYSFAVYLSIGKDESWLDLTFDLHALSFITIYAVWGMLYPKLAKWTHHEVGANIDSDDVENISDGN